MATMIVNVLSLSGKQFTVTLDDHASGREAKEAIERKEGYPFDAQRLLFEGRRLRDDDDLHTLGVRTGSLLHLFQGHWPDDREDEEMEPRKRVRSSSSTVSSAHGIEPVPATEGSVLVITPMRVADWSDEPQRLLCGRYLVPLDQLTPEQRRAVDFYTGPRARDLTRWASFRKKHHDGDDVRWSTRMPWALEQLFWRLDSLGSPKGHIYEDQAQAMRGDLSHHLFSGGPLAGAVRLLIVGLDNDPGHREDAFYDEADHERCLFFETDQVNW